MVASSANAPPGAGARRPRSRPRGSVRSRSLRWSTPPRSPLPSSLSASPRRHCSLPALDPITPLPVGTEVEVRVDDDGFYGSWFEATVLDFAPARGYRHPARYTVKYVHLLAEADDEGVLAEPFAPSHIRPRPPLPSSPPRFRPHHIVEAFHNEGWWSGIVVSAAGAGVTVAFPVTREVIEFPSGLVRPRCDYVDGDWIPSRVAMVVRPSRTVRVYEVGDKVEVVRNRDVYGDSWFPATVKVVIDNLSYVVEYFDLEEEEGGLEKATEYLHWRFIRPAFEHTPGEGEFQLQPGDAVEAYCDGAWSPGVVHRVVSEGEYDISIVGKKAELLVTKVVELLKPRYKWNGNRWRIATAKTNLRWHSKSGESPISPVDLTSSDEEHSHDPDSSSIKKSRKKLKQLDATLAEGSEHASVSEMDIPLSAMCKSPESTHSPNSLLSEKSSPQGSHVIVNLVPMNGLHCASSGHSAPVDNQAILSDMGVFDGELHESVSGRSVDAYDMLPIAELRKKMASARRNCAVQHTEEQHVKSLRVKKCISNSKDKKTRPIQELMGEIQLKGNKNFSRDFVLALGVSRDGPTTLSPDRLVSIGPKRCSSTKVLACKKLAKRRGSKELCSPNSSLDVTRTDQQGGRKEVAEAMKECSLALECPKSDAQGQLDRTLEDAKNITELSNQENLLSMLPPGFKSVSNRKGTNIHDAQLGEEPAVMTNNSLIEPNGNDDMCTDHAATTKLAENYNVMETAIMSIDCPAQQPCGEVDERSVLGLKNAGSTQCIIDSSPSSESLLPSPQALFVKSSPVWHIVEAMHVFKELPQQPHFIPLQEVPPTLREGMALGMMVSFADLVKVTMEASIGNDMEWFEDKIRTISHLEANGFSVQSIQSAMTEMVKVKTEHTSYHCEIGKLSSKLVENMASSSRAGALLDEKDEAAARLEEELVSIRQESQKIAKEKEKIDAEVVSIKTACSGYEDLCSGVERKFKEVLAGLQRKRLT
ncbi:DUF724 domain-containing protein 6 isoform X2 [Zea mays]|uniref:Agenet domain-containing protein n=1 Tax=Zea mays TaxID=4577 RepID=A0A804P1G3_MAIZE|nr:DUF724 domain-containing protein 6 isoform X2 [Zea mays]|eukprot:XP_008679660.1 DUF724 domain-containing protein 6 isoform X2 [Zea mays]